MALHPQPAHLPTTSVPSLAQLWLCPWKMHHQLLDGCLQDLGTCTFSRGVLGRKARFDTSPLGTSQLRDKKQQCKVITPAGKSPKQVEEAQRGSSAG